MNATALDLSNGLKTFITTLIDDKIVSTDENRVVERLRIAGHNVNPKDVRTIMEFARSCGYLKLIASQLVFTKKALGRVSEWKAHNRKEPELKASAHPDSGVCLTGV